MSILSHVGVGASPPPDESFMLWEVEQDLPDFPRFSEPAQVIEWSETLTAAWFPPSSPSPFGGRFVSRFAPCAGHGWGENTGGNHVPGPRAPRPAGGGR